MSKQFNSHLLRVAFVALLALSPGFIFAQSEAGGIFLLIAPGARAGGMGEANVAVANDAYASYYNPAGLAFQRNQELAFMHVNWLPGLADDLYYEFLAYRKYIPNLGTVGAHMVYFNLGQQARTGENDPTILDRWYSYMWNIALSYSAYLNQNSAFGLNVKIFKQYLSPRGAGGEPGKGASTDFAFDLAYMHKKLFTDRLTFGATLTNMGPKITFIDADQGDPPPTTLKIGLNYRLIDGEFNTLNVVYDASKLLVQRKSDGEAVPFYKAIFTSWNDEPIGTELKQITHNFGVEYWYNHMFALRVGGIYDEVGKLKMKNGLPIPTFGAGIRYANYGFDFGYTSGDPDHPLNNTMRFSLNMKF